MWDLCFACSSRPASVSMGSGAEGTPVGTPRATCASDECAASEKQPSSTNGNGKLFIHFLPPPLRAKDKAALPWIVHYANGTKCREAKHVIFESIEDMRTHEGTVSPEEAGKCTCVISKHNLQVRHSQLAVAATGLHGRCR